MDTPIVSGAWLALPEEAREAHWQELLHRQEDLEDTARSMGSERFSRRLAVARAKGRESTVGGARSLLVQSIEPMTKAIEAYLESQKAQRGVKHCSVKWIMQVGPDVAAYLTAKVVLDVIARKSSLRATALAITDLLMDELRYRRYKELAPGLFKYKMAKFTTTSYAHMARSMQGSLGKAACTACRAEGRTQGCEHLACRDLTLPQTQQILIGAKLIDLFMAATGLVEVYRERVVKGRGQRKRIRDDLALMPTAETVKWLGRRNLALETLYPVNLPMIVPPLPWSLEQRGGYRYALKEKYGLVRGAGSDAEAVVTRATMPVVYEALNAIQNTPWRVNTRVLEVVEQLVQRGGGVAGLPLLTLDPEPEKPEDIGTDKEARKQWRKAAGRVKESNIMRLRYGITFSKTVNAARTVREEEAIYFPYNLDFRGRIYPVTNFLNPQGDDLAKGLLMFAQGKPLGSEEAAGWLAVHGANCLDKTPEGQKVNKMTLQERVDWIVAHSQEIIQAAGDPLTHQWWMQAGEPLQFLAFCFEWAGYSREGLGYVCALPVAQDGSCNGLQHFSAMLRDEIGGAAVNLLPQDRPSDVYDIIAQAVLAELELSAHTDEVAALWLSSGLVNRALCKRPTMTFSYGSKPYGFQQQLLEYLRTDLGTSVEASKEEWERIRAHFTVTREGKEYELAVAACGLMSRLIWGALRDTVRAAFEGMQWLQKCARIVVASGRPLEWAVPATGFPVRQGYFVDTSTQVKTLLAGRVIQPRAYEATPEVSTYKQANAVSPNVVHSLDAAALMLTVSRASSEGIEHFAVVHDSYGTLAADMPLLSQITRQSFVRLYTSCDVVADLARQFQAQAPEGAVLPPPPVPGGLDVGLVIASDFFFC